MGYSTKVKKLAADRLAGKRLSAQRDADRRRVDIYARFPRVEQLEREISACGIKAARAVLGGGDVVEQMQQMRERNLAMQNELNEILVSNGYDKDVLEPKYSCQKCEDTGYYEDNGRTLMCRCLKQTLVACACEELNRTAPLSLSTFDSFNLDYYDSRTDPKLGISPYTQMERIFRFCKAYAQNFKNDSDSILMKGATGLGKTHLSLAIANEVIKRGYGVIYVSAPSITQKLEKQYFGREDDESLTEMLVNCDLLIVDDLGTEFHRQFAISQLYNIFNSRLLSGKPNIISTNLSLKDMENIYTERFVSRIIGYSTKLDFIGKDVRVRR